MESFLFFIDRLSAGVGKAFGWCIMIMTMGTCYEVFMRYVLRAPTDWAFDMAYCMYGALFMMAGAYTLSRNGHVRGDVVFRLWPPRMQAGIEVTLYIIFFFPAFGALLYYGISLRLDLLADPRSDDLQPGGSADLSAQGAHSARRPDDADSGRRRGHPMLHLSARWGVAAATPRR